MKVALLHYAAPPVVGGVESVLAHQASLMADAGHHVRVLAGRGAQTDPRVAFIQIPLFDSRHPYVLEIKRELDVGRIPTRFAELVESDVDELVQHLHEVDVLLCHNVASLNKNLALTAALQRFCTEHSPPRMILWHHDLAWTTPRYRNELHNGYPWDLLRTAWQGAVQVVVSDLRRSELSELFGIDAQAIQVIPNGVDIAAFLKLEDQTRSFIHQLDLLEAAPLFLLPVRITPRKNIEFALQVLASLRKLLPDAVLVVTGPLGPHNPANTRYFKELQALRDELELYGAAHFLADMSKDYLPDTLIADFYKLADALLFPSLEEGFGIPLLEAGIMGLPVFCADIPPLRELGGENVVYFNPNGDASSVAQTIYRRLAHDPVYQQRIIVRNTYSWEQVYTEKIEPLLFDQVGA